MTLKTKILKTVTTRIGIAGVSLGLAIIIATPAVAVGAINSHASAQAAAHAAASPAQTASSNASNGSSQASTHQAAAQTKLASSQLKACQNRQTAIDNIMSRIADRGQKQLDLFTTIATRVETFYTKQGKTLSNYSSLTSDVNTQKSAAQNAVDTIKSSSAGFDCSGTDPKGFINAFQGSLKSEISALQAYRTAVKNLIVGVKSVQGTPSSSSAGSNSTGNTGQSSTGGNQ